jgi:ribosome recycling factor
MNTQEIIEETRRKMEGTLNVLIKEFQGLRTGRASPNFLDPVVVPAYGDRMPLSQVATISVVDSKIITIQVWDQSLIKTVEKAIASAGLGINPTSEGQLIKIILPPLSEERRSEIAKLAAKYGENAKISLRNVRRDGLEDIKKLYKDSIISEDEFHKTSDKVQKIIDEFSNKIDEKVTSKEKEIKQL